MVIAILSILAGLLLPALEEAIATATRTACVSQLRQQYLALTMYLDDFEQNMPYRTSGHQNNTNAVTGRKTWMEYAPDYTAQSIWVCPEYRRNGDEPGGGISWSAAASWGGGYSLRVPVRNTTNPTGWSTGDPRDGNFYQNALPKPKSGHWSERLGNRLDLLEDPEKVILINEECRTDTWDQKHRHGGDPRHTTSGNPEGGAILYADGHIEWSWKMYKWPWNAIWYADR